MTAPSAGDLPPRGRPIKPLPHRPEILARIRPMQMRDARRVAELHQAAMGHSLWARLGIPFLNALYRALVDTPPFLAFVYEEEGRIRGFIAGSTDTTAMFREVFRRSWLPLGLRAVPGILRDPATVPLLVRTGTYFDVSGADVPAESLFCSFERDLRGTGVSNLINKVLFDDLCARGHSRVKITTEVDNEGANRQLTSWGFEPQARFRFYGKDMVRYVLDLTACPRVEPVSRHPSLA